MKHLYDYTWAKMGINPSEHKILLTEPPLNPRDNQKKMLEVSPAVSLLVGLHSDMFVLRT
mgnify:CR=1 FL=1